MEPEAVPVMRVPRSSVTSCVVVTQDPTLAEALTAFNRPYRFVIMPCIAGHLGAFLESFTVTHVIVDVRHTALEALQPMPSHVVAAACDSNAAVVMQVERLLAECERPLGP